MSDDQTTGQKLRALIARTGMSISAFAQEAGYAGPSSIQRYLDLAEGEFLTAEVAAKFAVALVGRGDPRIESDEIYGLCGEQVLAVFSNAVRPNYDSRTDPRAASEIAADQVHMDAPNAALRDIRKSQGLTQRQLGDAVGIHWTMVNKLESGKRKVSWDYAQRFARVLSVSPEVIFGAPVPGFAKPASHHSTDPLERIASALERIADLLERPRSLL